MRERACNNPAPQYGGNQCSGSSTENGNCNAHPCPSAYKISLV